MDHNAGNLHNVQITGHSAKADIELDGEPVSPGAVGAYTVSQLPGEPAHVVLHLTGQEETRFAGLARVSVADAPDPGPAAAVFLAAIDAEALEHAALARLDMGSGPNALTQTMLDQLGEWARGL